MYSYKFGSWSFEMITLATKKFRSIGAEIGAAIAAPSQAQIQYALFVLGVVLLTAGLATGATAAIDSGDGLSTTYNDVRVAESVNAILTYMEGSFGVLVMVSAGIGAILSSAFGQYRAALGLLVVAVGAFILRSLISTFFNDATIKG